MSFLSSIDKPRQLIVWTRSIQSLASISESIKFIINSRSVTLSSVNSARTSHGEVTLSCDFFTSYGFEPPNSDSEELDDESDESESDCESHNRGSCSFIVNSRHLALLFKNLEPSELDKISFKSYWAFDTPLSMKFKLLTEIRTKNLVIKKYSTNYQPVKKNRLKVSRIYHQKVISQFSDVGSQDSERVHFMRMENVIPKDFLEMLPTNTEDFKVEIKNEKISLTGFTRKVVHEREILKQPMSVTITLNAFDLIETNLQFDNRRTQDKKVITVRLKDFRNFTSLISNKFTSDHETKNTSDNHDSHDNNDYFDMYFKSPGFPVLLETNIDPSVNVQFVLIAGEDSQGESIKQSNTNTMFTIDAHELKKVHDHDVVRKSSSKANIREDIPSMNVDFVTDEILRETPLLINNYSDNGLSHNFHEAVTYSEDKDQEVVSLSHNMNQEIRNYNADNDLRQNTRSFHYKRDNTHIYDGDDDHVTFGPTQQLNKPKSIIDQ